MESRCECGIEASGSISHGVICSKQKKSVATFRLTIGHDYMAGHQFRTAMFLSPKHVLCKDPTINMDSLNQLQCPAITKMKEEKHQNWGKKN